MAKKQPEARPAAAHKLFCAAYGLQDADHLCECGASSQAAVAAEQARQQALVGDGVVRVGRETAGRKGAGVTVVTGIPLEGKPLKELVKRLKKLCGGGGSIVDGKVEIQGDHRDKIVSELQKRGWTVKKSGG
jgi:translation initiation factor 1